MKASDRYRLRILPAGKSDRVAELSDGEGNILKSIFCPHRLADEAGGLDEAIKQDFEMMEAGAFANKYGVAGSPGEE